MVRWPFLGAPELVLMCDGVGLVGWIEWRGMAWYGMVW